MDRGKVEATSIPSIDHFIGGWLATVSRRMTRRGAAADCQGRHSASAGGSGGRMPSTGCRRQRTFFANSVLS